MKREPSKSPKSIDWEEARFQIVKAMLREFPELKRRIKEYLEREL